MAHVTFIHGIANKPPADDLLAIWRRALAEAADPIALGDLGISSSMVYWADLMYAHPDANLAAHEGIFENTAAAVDASADARIPIPRTAAEAAFLDAMRAHLTLLSDSEIAAAPAAAPAAAGALERVPLPWFLKKQVMATLLRDVHHYLFDVEFAPGGGAPVCIRKSVRERFVKALAAPEVTAPHVIVSHSMGTIVAYDCLKRVHECPAIDGLITIGS
jgi:hypothetical protein